jgi:hypothetical protein
MAWNLLLSLSIAWRPQEHKIRRIAIFAVVSFMACLLAWSGTSAESPSPGRILSVQERTALQQAMDQVLWDQRAGDEGSRTAGPPMEVAVQRSSFEEKAVDALRKSAALETYWGASITSEQLQAEMNRMAAETQQPDVLAKLWGALGNDPYVIAEMMARPLLAERFIHALYVRDARFHQDVRERALEDLQKFGTTEGMKSMGGIHTEMLWTTSASRGSHDAYWMTPAEWESNQGNLRRMFNIPQNGVLPLNVLSPLQEDDGRFYVMALISQDQNSVRLSTVAWEKTPMDVWWNSVKETFPANLSQEQTQYSLPGLRSSVCSDDTWTPTSAPPAGRKEHIAFSFVSGAVNYLFIWGGHDGVSYVNSGYLYNFTTGTWTSLPSTNAPSVRTNYSAALSGSRVFIWGGYDLTQSPPVSLPQHRRHV